MEIKDTQHLQMKSLYKFMEALGYSYGEWGFFHWKYKSIHKVSFNTAIKLHNGYYTEWHGKYFNPPFDKISSYEFTVANASKIVKTVKLQYSKKKKEIKVMSHVVSFVKPEYYDLFLGDS